MKVLVISWFIIKLAETMTNAIIDLSIV